MMIVMLVMVVGKSGCEGVEWKPLWSGRLLFLPQEKETWVPFFLKISFPCIDCQWKSKNRVKTDKNPPSGVWLHLVWIISSWICPRHREAVGLGEGFYEVGIVNKQIQKTYRLICYYEGQSGPNGDDGGDAFPFHFWAVVISILCFMKQNVWNWLKGSEFVKRNIVWCGAHLHSLNISQLNHDHANENDDDKWCLWWYKYN